VLKSYPGFYPHTSRSISTTLQLRTKPMQYKVFYTSHSRQESASSTAPRLLDAEQLEALALRILADEDDFLGVIDNDDRIIQFMRSSADELLVELPDFDARESLQCRLSTEQALELLRYLPGRLQEMDLTRFVPVSWSRR